MNAVTVIRFRVTKEERETIEIEAKKLGLSMSTFIRLLIRQWVNGNKRILPEKSRENESNLKYK